MSTGKKRIMTPQECSGKFLVSPHNSRHVVKHISESGIEFFLSCGFKISDSPTSEPYSLIDPSGEIVEMAE